MRTIILTVVSRIKPTQFEYYHLTQKQYNVLNFAKVSIRMKES